MTTATPSTAIKKTGRLQRWVEMLRDPNPILVKELRSTFRTRLFVRFLYVATGVIGIIVLMSGAIMAGESETPADVGKMVFHLFFGLATVVVSLVAPPAASTAITGEIETNTFEPLILTGMDPARIVRGKFLAIYAVFALVLIALSPVVGIAFLFGGISPLTVFWGFYGLFLFLAPAVAFGIAVSARSRATRVAIVVSSMLFQPGAMILASFVLGMGAVASTSWGIGFEDGPFWFAEVLATRFFHLDTFLLLFLLPLYITVMAVWFFLASAIASVRPAAEDRSTPFKWWTLVAIVGQLAILMMALFFGGISRTDAETGVVFLGVASAAALFYASIFMNEPPLPPRMWELRQLERGPLGKFAGLFGPGAMSTARVATLFILGSMGLSLVLCLGYFRPHGDELLATVLMVSGSCAVALFYLNLGAWLRVLLRNGVAARVLSMLTLFTLLLLLLLFAYILDPDMGGSASAPVLLLFSPVGHFVGAAAEFSHRQNMSAAMMVIHSVIYFGGAALFSLLLRGRVRQAKMLNDARRAASVRMAAERKLLAAAAQPQESAPLEAGVVSDTALEARFAAAPQEQRAAEHLGPEEAPAAVPQTDLSGATETHEIAQLGSQDDLQPDLQPSPQTGPDVEDSGTS